MCYFVKIVAIWTYLKLETIVTLQLELKNWSGSKEVFLIKTSFYQNSNCEISHCSLNNFLYLFQICIEKWKRRRMNTTALCRDKDDRTDIKSLLLKSQISKISSFMRIISLFWPYHSYKKLYYIYELTIVCIAILFRLRRCFSCPTSQPFLKS